MNTNRRKFFQIAGAAGAGILSGGFASCSRPSATSEELPLAAIREAAGKSHPQQFNMCGYAAPKLETVRIGFIGLGNRGTGAVSRMSNIEGVEIVALCDKDPECIERAQGILKRRGLPEAKGYTGSEDAWKALCESPDIDLVYICTPWSLHAPMCVYAMESGKHAASEVPAAVTVDEAWQLVETSERTKKHCMMLENCCYDFFELLTLNMARQGFFGEIVHVEGAYIHDLLTNNFGKDSYSDMWRLRENQQRNGNLYPTHGLGPVCQVLNVNRGDKMVYLTSMSTNDFQMGKMAAEKAGEDGFYEQFATGSYRGNMNTTTIRTHKGKTIMIQHDVTSPRPYSRIHLVSGTEGIARKYPLPGRIAKGHEWFDEDELKVLEEQYTPEIVKLVGDMARRVGGHGGMDFIMDWRLIDCLRNGIPLDQDVYDAALWSVIAPLSEWSVANRSDSIDVPDFTNGKWQTNVPVDITLSQGGTTGVKVRAEAEKQMSAPHS
jgi:predicted dehydrogenase